MRPHALALPAVVLLLAAAPLPHDTRSPVVEPNDNHHAAGVRRGRVLHVALEAREGTWHPSAEGAPLRSFAFGEEGKPLQTPGPLLRVRAGMEIRATVHNSLPKTMWVFGLGARHLADSAEVMPGATREFRFIAADPGAFYYVARTDTNPVFARFNEDSQLGGVIMVDPAGSAPPAHEEILAITSWVTLDPSRMSGIGANGALAFNGRSWPATDRLAYTQGDTVHFRVVNLSFLDHPLHLHGFYFSVDHKGNGMRDSAIAADDRHWAVTEYVQGMETLGLTWVPERPGNWIFHCHFASHIASGAALDADRTDISPHTGHASMQSHMSGLVMGISVKARGEVMQMGDATREIRLVVRSRAKVYGGRYVGYSYLLGGSPEEADSTAMPVPGPLLELVRGERVAITIVNRSHEQAAVHWHGIELESFPDGVPGWSGAGANVLPMIAPGDSFTVRFTPPRAGTFMYHSHSNELQQIGSGLYGAIVVRERGAPRDSMRDRVVVISDNGPITNLIDPHLLPGVLLNGRRDPRPLAVAAGQRVRLRIIDIRADAQGDVALLEDGAVSRWTPVARDGRELSGKQRAEGPATFHSAVGIVHDVEFVPRAGHALALRYSMRGNPPDVPDTLSVAIRPRSP